MTIYTGIARFRGKKRPSASQVEIVEHYTGASEAEIRKKAEKDAEFHQLPFVLKIQTDPASETHEVPA